MDESNTDPTWWDPAHDSVWQRVKAAMKRDWEQTKSNFGVPGTDLNQDAGDTFRHVMGSAPIPPEGQVNAPSADDMDRHIETSRTADWSAAAARRQALAAAPDTDEEHRLTRQADAADVQAAASLATLHDNEDRRWANVESALQFGFRAGLRYTEPWDDAKAALEPAWSARHPEQSWRDVEMYIQRGWDRARAGDETA